MTQPSESPEPAATSQRYYRRGPLLMLMLAVVIVALDQATKIWAVATLEGQRPIHLIGDTVRLVLLRNSGAAFSLGSDSTIIFGVLSAAVVVALLWFSRTIHSRWWAWGLGLVLGGAAGNLIDRLVRSPGVLRGHVVDFLSVGWWPVFNVADSSLMCGVAVIMIAVLRGEDQDGQRGAAANE